MNAEELRKAAEAFAAENWDEQAKEFEDGTWDTSDLVRAPVGRPKLYADEESETVSVRLPASLVAKFDEQARQSGINRSQILRELLMQA